MMGIITNLFGFFKRRKKKKDAETYVYKPKPSLCDDCEFLFECDRKIEFSTVESDFTSYLPPISGCVMTRKGNEVEHE